MSFIIPIELTKPMTDTHDTETCGPFCEMCRWASEVERHDPQNQPLTITLAELRAVLLTVIDDGDWKFYADPPSDADADRLDFVAAVERRLAEQQQKE